MSGLSNPAAPAGHHARLRPSAIVVALGAAVMTAGTFAPWLASGTSARNLYSSAGLVERLAGLGRPVGLALNAMPLTGLYCVAAGVAYVIGWRRIAAGAMALLAVVFAGIASAALSHRRSGEVHLLAAGPSVTLAGALVCLASVLAAVGQLQHDARVLRRTATAGPAPSTTTDLAPHPVAEPAPNPSQGRPRTMEFR